MVGGGLGCSGGVAIRVAKRGRGGISIRVCYTRGSVNTKNRSPIAWTRVGDACR